MTEQNARLGIAMMVLTTFIFAVQDGVSRYLADEYNTIMVIMIRYWFFALFVIAVAARKAGGVRVAARTSQPVLQAFRGLLLVAEICILVQAFTLLGLIETHAIFACYPLLIAALSGPVLGERVGWRRWAAIGVGFIGVLIILKPGLGVFRPEAILAVIGTFMFALYGLLTRYVARRDPAATSFFWTGVMGAIGITIVGLWHLEPMARSDWGWMAALCVTGAAGHYTLIKCYEVAEASVVQPFAYLQLAFVSVIGVTVFNEAIRTNVAVGTGIVVAAGLFTLWRQRVTAR